MPQNSSETVESEAHFIAKEILKGNNTINTCLIRLCMILYYYLPLNIYEYLICQIYK